MTLSDEQIAELEAVRAKLEVRMVEKPRRYQHSLGVAKTAYEIARAYDVDCFSAALAGLLHDWDKVLDDHEPVSYTHLRIAPCASTATMPPLRSLRRS